MNWNPTPFVGRIIAPARGEAYSSPRLKIDCGPQAVLCGYEVVIRHRRLRLCKVKEHSGHVYVPAKKVVVDSQPREGYQCKCDLQDVTNA